MPQNAKDRAAKIALCQLFGTYELAELWGVSQRTIRRWIGEGRLLAKRGGPRDGRYFVLRGEVERFVHEELTDAQVRDQD